jgi:hypothetical protein
MALKFILSGFDMAFIWRLTTFYLVLVWLLIQLSSGLYLVIISFYMAFIWLLYGP